MNWYKKTGLRFKVILIVWLISFAVFNFIMIKDVFRLW
jgi:hypothetical protein